jgi:hypothetical protein
MSLAQPEAPIASGRLPLGVYLLAGLRIADAAVLIAAATGARQIAGDSVIADLLPDPAYLDALYVIAAVLSVAVAIGLVAGHRWGWAGAMILTGFGLLLADFAFVKGASNDVRLILLVLSAFYLNQRVVRERFWGRRS